MTEPLPDALSRPLRFAVVGAGQMGGSDGFAWHDQWAGKQ